MPTFRTLLPLMNCALSALVGIVRRSAYDFTYVATWSGMVFTAFVHDVFSRRIVGWRTATSMPTELPLDALEMALWTRARAGHDTHGVVHHSDAGTQYTSIRYSERLLDAGALASIGTVGDSYDNAQTESLIGLYKTEHPLRGPLAGRLRPRARHPELGPLVQRDTPSRGHRRHPPT